MHKVQIPWGKKWVGGDWVYQHVRFQQAPCPPNWWSWVVSTTLFKITSKRARSIFFTNFITSHNSSKIQSGNCEINRKNLILLSSLSRFKLEAYSSCLWDSLLQALTPIRTDTLRIYSLGQNALPLATWFFLYNPNLNWHSYPINLIVLILHFEVWTSFSMTFAFPVTSAGLRCP